jgi:hypothetical protein
MNEYIRGDGENENVSLMITSKMLLFDLLAWHNARRKNLIVEMERGTEKFEIHFKSSVEK